MFPLPKTAYAPSVVRRVAEVVLELLAEPATAEEMLAASPRWPPEGAGWKPLPWLTPRLAARLPWVRIGNASGSGFALLRYVLLAMANRGLVELDITPMSTSPVGRIRFLRPLERAASADLQALFHEPRRPRFFPWREGVRY